MYSKKNVKNINKFLYKQAPLLILIVLVIIISILNKEFLSLQTLSNLLQQVSAVGIVALGAMIVIICGGIDFTAGNGLAMIGMAAGTVYAFGHNFNNLLLIVIISLLFGSLLGFVNGVIISKLNVQPFITTLAIMSVAKGLSLMIGGGNMVKLTDKQILFIGQKKFFGFLPMPFIIFIFVALMMYVILNKTKLGIYSYAIGSNEEAARFVGINIARYKILIYVLAGICTGIASLLTISRIAMTTPNIAGTILLDAITAVIIGGTSLSGGKGTVSGTIIGVFIVIVISTALVFLKITPEMQDFFKGSIILVAVGIDAYGNKYFGKHY